MVGGCGLWVVWLVMMKVSMLRPSMSSIVRDIMIRSNNMDWDDWDDCEDCPYYRRHKGRTSGDPDDCYPDEDECLDGDFGDDYLCERVLSRLEETCEESPE
jgi:hypothetical protein